jgi:hypothetical protein
MKSYGGFVWPRSGPVLAPDWEPTEECGNGLHGLLWGEGDATQLDWRPGAVGLVIEILEYIDLGGKVKFPKGNVVFCGPRAGAIAYVRARAPVGTLVVGTTTAGYRGVATAGDYDTATAGDHGTAVAGYRGVATAGNDGAATAGNHGTATAGHFATATAGDYGTATAGDYGTATAGYYGTATAGDGGTATSGYYGTATAGDGGTLIVKWYDGPRSRCAIAYVGEGGIKPNTPYNYDPAFSWVERHEVRDA